LIFTRSLARRGVLGGDSGRGRRVFARCRRFRSEDLAMPEPGPDFGSVGGGSGVQVAPESSYISLVTGWDEV
jgi:hypothetical protein